MSRGSKGKERGYCFFFFFQAEDGIRDRDVTSSDVCSSDLCGHYEQISSKSYKEVIQPQVPLGLPCYDFTPVMNHSVVNVLPRVRLSTSGATHSHGVTGGVYKARERIHRIILICDY